MRQWKKWDSPLRKQKVEERYDQGLQIIKMVSKMNAEFIEYYSMKPLNETSMRLA